MLRAEAIPNRLDAGRRETTVTRRVFPEHASSPDIFYIQPSHAVRVTGEGITILAPHDLSKIFPQVTQDDIEELRVAHAFAGPTKIPTEKQHRYNYQLQHVDVYDVTKNQSGEITHAMIAQRATVKNGYPLYQAKLVELQIPTENLYYQVDQDGNLLVGWSNEVAFPNTAKHVMGAFGTSNYQRIVGEPAYVETTGLQSLEDVLVKENDLIRFAQLLSIPITIEGKEKFAQIVLRSLQKRIATPAQNSSATESLYSVIVNPNGVIEPAYLQELLSFPPLVQAFSSIRKQLPDAAEPVLSYYLKLKGGFTLSCLKGVLMTNGEYVPLDSPYLLNSNSVAHIQTFVTPTGENRLQVVDEIRLGKDGIGTQIPAGTQDKRGEPIVMTASRELEEETGQKLLAQQIFPLLTLSAGPHTSEVITVTVSPSLPYKEGDEGKEGGNKAENEQVFGRTISINDISSIDDAKTIIALRLMDLGILDKWIDSQRREL